MTTVTPHHIRSLVNFGVDFPPAPPEIAVKLTLASFVMVGLTILSIWLFPSLNIAPILTWLTIIILAIMGAASIVKALTQIQQIPLIKQGKYESLEKLKNEINLRLAMSGYGKNKSKRFYSVMIEQVLAIAFALTLALNVEEDLSKLFLCSVIFFAISTLASRYTFAKALKAMLEHIDNESWYYNA